MGKHIKILTDFDPCSHRRVHSTVYLITTLQCIIQMLTWSWFIKGTNHPDILFCMKCSEKNLTNVQKKFKKCECFFKIFSWLELVIELKLNVIYYDKSNQKSSYPLLFPPLPLLTRLQLFMTKCKNAINHTCIWTPKMRQNTSPFYK